MTEFDAVAVRGLRNAYGPCVVVDRLDIDVQRGEMAGGAGKTITVGCIHGLRRRGDGALSVLGDGLITGAVQLRPLIGSQLQDSALPNRLRVAGALDLSVGPRAGDGTELLGQLGLDERGRQGLCSLSGPERQRLFLVLALPGRPGRTS
jgi:ABC-2 type transport system ATP-binding protein